MGVASLAACCSGSVPENWLIVVDVLDEVTKAELPAAKRRPRHGSLRGSTMSGSRLDKQLTRPDRPCRRRSGRRDVVASMGGGGWMQVQLGASETAITMTQPSARITSSGTTRAAARDVMDYVAVVQIDANPLDSYALQGWSACHSSLGQYILYSAINYKIHQLR